MSNEGPKKITEAVQNPGQQNDFKALVVAAGLAAAAGNESLRITARASTQTPGGSQGGDAQASAQPERVQPFVNGTLANEKRKLFELLNRNPKPRYSAVASAVAVVRIETKFVGDLRVVSDVKYCYEYCYDYCITWEGYRLEPQTPEKPSNGNQSRENQ